MSTSLETVRNWCEKGKADGARFLVVLCDTYDWSDYPTPCVSDKDVKVAIGDAESAGERIHKSSTIKVMEVFDLSRDIEEQLAEFRAWHPPAQED